MTKRVIIKNGKMKIIECILSKKIRTKILAMLTPMCMTLDIA